MKFYAKIASLILTASMAFTVVAGSAVAFTSPISYAPDKKQGSDLNVDYHTKEEIVQFIMDHPTSAGYKCEYAVEPNIDNHVAGRLTDDVLNGALNELNIYRYIAGVPANVTLSDEYTNLAQHAALVNATNNQMSHGPSQPAGMPDDIYQLGYRGASSSNLGWGYRSVASVVDGFVGEQGSSLGHRRWCLNPTMDQTGFGHVGAHTAQYAFGRGNTAGEGYNAVSWPGQVTPIQYFDNSDVWSVSMGDIVNDDTATVTLTRQSDGATYSATSGSGVEVNNVGYGQTGCIIFTPGSDYDFVEPGSIISVHIEGDYDSYSNTSHFSVDYTVEFFDVRDYILAPFVSRLYQVCLDRRADESGLDGWINQLKTGESTGSEAAYGFVFSQEFNGKNYCNECYVKHLYNAFMGRDADAAGLQAWVSQLESGTTREEVFNGFALSQEFTSLCQQYEIEVGSGIPVPEYGTIPSGNCSQCGKESGTVSFVKRLYNVCLDREADQGGLNGWVSNLVAHTSSGREVAYGFIFSPEFIGRNFSNEEYVEYLYKAFFNRPSDAAGKAAWVNQLNSGVSREEVFNGFVGSREFSELCSRYGIVRG